MRQDGRRERRVTGRLRRRRIPDSPDAPASTIADPTPADGGDVAATWWATAVFYQIYRRSFSDSDGDGVGDLPGVIDKLGYLELLGVDARGSVPSSASPMADHGYDVSDPRDIDPLFAGSAHSMRSSRRRTRGTSR